MLCFNEYWHDPRFQFKKPDLFRSLKYGYGDNIYFKDGHGQWSQLNSHHSLEDGTPNRANVNNDTQADRMLVGRKYAYWGGIGPKIPERFRDFNGTYIQP